mmetsp:Transcript_24927/g.78038  ORF Transcript_24927/g.78038 Transcript_24927/m.78038 type:complete len:289 (+) Transcript_24927:350-1216(+)
MADVRIGNLRWVTWSRLRVALIALTVLALLHNIWTLSALDVAVADVRPVFCQAEEQWASLAAHHGLQHWRKRSPLQALAVLVVGAESAGTKLIAKLCARALLASPAVSDGWQGHGSVGMGRKLVIHRSLPHGAEEPCFVDALALLERFVSETGGKAVLVLVDRVEGIALQSKVRTHQPIAAIAKGENRVAQRLTRQWWELLRPAHAAERSRMGGQPDASSDTRSGNRPRRVIAVRVSYEMAVKYGPAYLAQDGGLYKTIWRAAGTPPDLLGKILTLLAKPDLAHDVLG